MANRELANKLASGEITQIKVGGTGSEKILTTDEVVTAKLVGKADQTDLNNTNAAVSVNTSDITTNTDDIAFSAEAITDISTGFFPVDGTLYADMTGSEPSWAKGQTYYSEGKMNINTAYSGVTLQVGEEQHIEVINNTGVDIADGKPVRYDVIAAGIPAVVLCQADTFTNARIMGVATMPIPAGTKGLVTSYGLVRDIDMSAFNNGDTLYIDETTAGVYTTTAPDIATRAGFVYSSDAITGSLFVAPEAHTSLPTILAHMKAGSVTGTSLGSTFLPVFNYAPDGNVVMPYDASAGTITTPTGGKYALGINFSAAFDTVGNSEESITLRLVGTVSGNSEIPVTVGRNGGTASAYPTIIFSAVAGEVFHLEIACTTATLNNFTMPLMAFNIESKHIR